MKHSALAAMVAVVLSSGAAVASTIDFSTNNGSTLTHGDFVDGAFNFDGITGTVSTSGGSGIAQVFDSSISRQIWTNDRDLQRPRDVDTGMRSQDLGNVLIVNEDRSRVDDNWSGGSITFMFDKVVKFLGVTLVDLEQNQPVTIVADGYNSGGQTNADNYFSHFTPGQSVFTQSITFRFAGSGAIDNLSVSEVPLPAPALLLLGGLGALGAMRRKKT